MSSTDSDLVTILVPKQHLSRIYGFIATLDEVGAPATPEKPTLHWPEELIRRQFLESPDTIKRFQKILAGHPGKRFSTSEIATKLNASKGSKTIAGALGAYGRRAANRYKMQSWPFANEWNHVEGQQYYWMEPKIAQIIKGL